MYRACLGVTAPLQTMPSGGANSNFYLRPNERRAHADLGSDHSALTLFVQMSTFEQTTATDTYKLARLKRKEHMERAWSPIIPRCSGGAAANECCATLLWGINHGERIMLRRPIP